MAIWRVQTDGRPRLARGPVDAGPRELLAAGWTLGELLAQPDAWDAAAGGELTGHKATTATGILAPTDEQEVWAAGVTYERSRTARTEESDEPDVYDRVYVAERPELFPKAAPGRCRGPGEPVVVRADSTWDVPEPELGVVADAHGRAVAYVCGNDVSSRAIEGDNPLYLPQAKVYDGSCAVGPCLVPVAEAPALADLEMSLRVERGEDVAYVDRVSVAAMRRSVDELLSWLFRAATFPRGVVLLTGTAIVPPPDFTLSPGDVVEIEIPGLGLLRNPVVRSDRARRGPTMAPALDRREQLA